MNAQLNYIYEIVIVDFAGKSEITTVKSLSNALAYSEKLWKDSIIKESHFEATIEDKLLGIELQVKKAESYVKSNETSFLLTVSSTYFDSIEKFRQKLLVHITSKLGFVDVKVLSDSVSEQISLSIYPLIKEVENVLRRNLTVAFLQKEGLGWWGNTASKTLSEQVNARKNLATTFSNLVDDSALLTDFDNLTELVEKSAYSDSQFKSKWEALAVIRQKVMTYAPLLLEDYSTCQQLTKEILVSLTGKESKASNSVLSDFHTTPVSVPMVQIAEVKTEEFAPVQDNTKVDFVSTQEEIKNTEVNEVKVETSQPFIIENEVQAAPSATIVNKQPEVPIQEKETVVSGNELISETEFLNELKKAESRMTGEFLDLKTFVTSVLANKGYATGYAYSLSRSLNENGKVVLYDAREKGSINVKAIKSV